MRHHRLLGIVALLFVAAAGCAEGVENDSAAICGDNSCTGAEDDSSCPQDCAGSDAVCGDNSCNGSETINTCPADCNGSQGAVCGDDTCNGTENATSCPQDCTGGTASCGDTVCNGTETSASCPVDCPATATCGDLSCDAGEDVSCPSDCGGGAAGCGDGVCDVASGECESADFDCVFDCIFDDACGGGGGGATPSCDHDVCTAGGPLLTSCGACEAAVCAADDWCCSNEWDSFCVDMVATECSGTTC